MKHLQAALCAHLKTCLQGKRVRLPDAGGEILGAFLELSRARTYHQFGPNPITWEALAAYGQVTGQQLPPHHTRIIMALDEVWLEDAALRMGNVGNSHGSKQSPPIASGPLSCAAFDAMFG